MKSRTFKKNEVQFDYFSDNYQRFEQDFYEYSKLAYPLSLIEEDILRTMAEGQCNYFRIPQSQSKDGWQHTFVFEVTVDPKNPLIRRYCYLYHYKD